MRLPLLSLALVGVSTVVLAKLPAPDDAAKAKAAETSAKNAWQAKVDAFQLCKAQDRVAAAYRKSVPAAARPASAVAVATPASAGPALANAAVAAGVIPPPAAASAAGAPTGAASGAVVAAAPIPPCLDPGPFAYAPPEQKPLETSGAHSPAPTATSPPSVREPAVEMAPAPKK